MANTHILIPIKDIEDKLENHEYNMDLECILVHYKQISLDEKDIEAKAFKGYYEYHNWNEEKQKRESIINLARGGEFTSGYKQALLELIK